MSKRKQHKSKGNTILKKSSVEATLDDKPYYNAYAVGHGVHGDTKYNRNKVKREFEKEIDPHPDS